MKKYYVILLLTTISLNMYGQWIDNGSSITTSDNVGIGTTAPNAKLSIIPLTNPTTVATPTFTLGESSNNTNYQFRFGYVLDATAGYEGQIQSWVNGSAGKIALNPLGGNVGIGTSNPNAKLQIVTGNANGISWKYSASYGESSISNTFDSGSDAGNKMNFNVNNAAGTAKNIMTLRGDGNVGIGTSNPTAVLEVNKGTNDIWTTFIKNDGGSSKGLLVKNGYGGSTSNAIILQLEDNESNVRLKVMSNGNIGIGTSIPNAKLTVIPTVTPITNTDAGLITIGEATNNVNYRLKLGYYLDATYGYASYIQSHVNGSGGTLQLNPNGGNVGIGTTDTKGHKLGVAGTVIAEEVIVALQADWADFVFSKDYKLKDLEEVENYIEENNHLPDIPSEKEVLENGIQLGEMDAKLLQKIEELTLYMIEMNKDVKALRNENELLKKRNKHFENSVKATVYNN